MTIQLFNDDCFNILPTIQNKSIDLFVLDLPYANFKFGNCTACKWDLPIDLDKMWIEIKRIMKPNAVIVFFCNTKFGYALIDSNPKWFKYDLIWKKSRKVGFLSANKQPLRQHENIYVFDNPENEEYNDLELNRNLDLRAYAEKVFKFIGKSLKKINNDLGHRRAEHFFYFKSSQFGLPILETYNELIKKYKINEMEGFIEYDILKDSWEDPPPKIHSTYNSQKTEGKPYILNEIKPKGKTQYGIQLGIKEKRENKGDRHPTSILPDDLKSTILEYNNPHKTIHRTQKPVKLLEWLIKTYSNEEDMVMDFCMGSGTAGVACKNTNRKFIGVEKDFEIFELAKNRIDNI